MAIQERSWTESQLQLVNPVRLMTAPHLFAEVFPIRTDALPPLTAYQVSMSGGDSARRVGGKLAAWFAAAFGGFWVYSSGRLITDAPPNPVKLIMSLEDARALHPKVYTQVENIDEDFHWQSTPEAIGDYVIHGRLAQVEDTILEALSRTVYSIQRTRVQREYRVRTWAVGGAPALSISVISRLLYEPDLQTYLESLPSPSEVVGLWVTDKSSSAQGEVIKLVGLLDEQRTRLLELAQRTTLRELIETAPGSHWVVRVLSGSVETDYVADALDLVIRPEDISHFAINEQQIEKALHLKPALHAQMVKLVSDVLKDANLIGNAYSTQNAPELFPSSAPQPNLVFAGGRVRAHSRVKLSVDTKDVGLYRLPERLKSNPLRVVVINTLAEEVNLFLEALKRSLERDFGVALEVVRERNMRVISPANLESAVRLLQKETSDLVVVFLPDETEGVDEEGISDRTTRAQTIGRGLPCLVVHESTINQPEAMYSVITGLLARAGAVPYVLADPLPFADRVVGLSLITQSKREGDYLTGIARIYGSDGTLLRGLIAGAPAAGGFPDGLLARLLPNDLLHKQRVLLHSDGRLRGDVQRALGSREDELDATFYPVEVMRAGVPRMYALTSGKIEPPKWGSILRLSENEAFVQPSDATTQPLHLRAEPPLTIEQAAHSVLLFTQFHYGALTAPKLPVTIHNAEPIENGILRGVMPPEMETTLPFWL